MSKHDPIYKDIDLSFSVHPVTGDLSILRDDAAVINAVKNLVLTNFHERPKNPKKGGNIRSKLFENFSPLTRATIEKEIKQVLAVYEARVELLRVEIDSQIDYNSVSVTIYLNIIQFQKEVKFDLVLDRTK